MKKQKLQKQLNRIVKEKVRSLTVISRLESDILNRINPEIDRLKYEIENYPFSYKWKKEKRNEK